MKNAAQMPITSASAVNCDNAGLPVRATIASGLPAFYSLHAWAWKHNPAGTFSMWNPNVIC